MENYLTNISKKKKKSCQKTYNETAIKADFHFSYCKSVETFKLP